MYKVIKKVIGKKITHSRIAMNWTRVQKLMAGVLLVVGLWNGAQAQVREYTFTPDTTAGKDGVRTEGAAENGQTVDLSGQVLMTKGVPRNPGMEVKGDGKPGRCMWCNWRGLNLWSTFQRPFRKGPFYG